MRDDFNEVLLSTVTVLSIEGVDERAVIDGLVRKLGPERAFLIFHAAKTYMSLPVVEVPAEDTPT